MTNHFFAFVKLRPMHDETCLIWVNPSLAPTLIIIWVETMEELKTRTSNVLCSIRKHDLKLNRNKCKYN